MQGEPFQQENLSFMEFAAQEAITAGISTRHGGTSLEPYESLNLGLHVGDDPVRVIKNRESMAERIRFPLEQWVCADQVHGSTIRKVTLSDAGKGSRNLDVAIPETDGLYTGEPGLFLALGYADCVPLYFFAPRFGFVGIAHAGWRGTTANIAGKMVDSWVNDEAIPREAIYAVIGPSIGPCCYEVDQRVIDAVNRVLGSEAGSVFQQTDESHYRLDLKACNRKLLLEAGISEDHIECSTYCTGCRTDLFYSHRNEKGRTGRMLGFIGMKSAIQSIK
ncbi:MAG TPA: peptidoglycan editing factor PgeF [Bacillales bacterium]|nr:peptidoglycan editing factor PgeF [Bacillales bacterium]